MKKVPLKHLDQSMIFHQQWTDRVKNAKNIFRSLTMFWLFILVLCIGFGCWYLVSDFSPILTIVAVVIFVACFLSIRIYVSAKKLPYEHLLYNYVLLVHAIEENHHEAHIKIFREFNDFLGISEYTDSETIRNILSTLPEADMYQNNTNSTTLAEVSKKVVIICKKTTKK